jgi:hypothetical protein
MARTYQTTMKCKKINRFKEGESEGDLLDHRTQREGECKMSDDNTS